MNNILYLQLEQSHVIVFIYQIRIPCLILSDEIIYLNHVVGAIYSPPSTKWCFVQSF